MGNRSRGRRGFTLIEILIVLGIIILLASTAIVALYPQQRGAKIDTTKIKLQAIRAAVDIYNVNIGHFPNEQEGGLDALRVKPSFDSEAVGQNWRGPYLTEEPLDAWGNKFNYQLTPPGTPEADLSPYKLWSNGPDLMDGTDDDIKYPLDATTGK